MKIFETDRDSKQEMLAALAPPEPGRDAELEKTVRGIIADVRARGDEALLELGRRFDSPGLESLRVTEQEFEKARSSIAAALLDAIRFAKSNIEEFHRRQAQSSWMDVREDYIYGQLVIPLDTVGFYAPGGLAPYPSTVLMAAVPARVAGVKRVVMCCPAQEDGNVHPAMLAAAGECGVGDVFKIGGAQAAAAMAYGTATVPKVDKIVGPGNAYVTEAKRQLFGIVGIDQLAGPSEILVLADDSANPAFVAADILSQAEHGPDSRCVLMTYSRRVADAVLREIRNQTDAAPRRDHIRQSLNEHGVVVIASDIDECVELANVFAPEHLELVVAEPWETLRKIRHAGSIMVGHHTPVPLCDFAAGPNHTLPTGGTARFSSPLGVEDFVKKSGLLSYTRDALERAAPTVLEIAGAEGFDAHANTIRIRLENSKKETPDG